MNISQLTILRLSLPVAAFFSFALGIGREEGKNRVVKGKGAKSLVFLHFASNFWTRIS